MKCIPRLLAIVSVTLALISCKKTLRIDGSSIETMDTSYKEMYKGLTEDEQTQLSEDFMLIAFIEFKSCKDQDLFPQQFRKKLNGKSREEIRQIADVVRKKAESHTARGIPNGNVAGPYLGGDTDHWLQEIIEPGRLVQLEDGSIWEIAPLSNVDAILWLMTEEIVVITSDDPFYPHKLINKDEGTSADAKLISQ